MRSQHGHHRGTRHPKPLIMLDVNGGSCVNYNVLDKSCLHVAHNKALDHKPLPFGWNASLPFRNIRDLSMHRSLYGTKTLPNANVKLVRTYRILCNGSFRLAVDLLTKCRHRSRNSKQPWEKRVAKKGVANIGSVLQYSLRELCYVMLCFTIPMRRIVTRKVCISLIVIVTLLANFPLTPGSLFSCSSKA